MRANELSWLILAGILLSYIGFLLLWYVLQVIAYWRIFTKAGERGWKSIIPVYNIYVQYRICWNTRMFWISLLLGIAAVIFGLTEGAVGMIGNACLAGVGIISIIGTYKLSLAYGHGIPFTVGLYFLNPVFLLILGFGSSEYHGPQ